MSSVDQLDELIVRLQRAAEQLRSGELSPDAAAGLAEDCAALATRAASELEQLTQSEVAAPAPGQDTLLPAPGQDTLLPAPGQDTLL